MKIIFVRHGEPSKDKYGITDIGKKEMLLLAKFMKDNFSVKYVYSATSQRAKESVSELNEILNKDVFYYEWLSEFKYPLKFKKLLGQFPWEIPPELWINDDCNLAYKDCLNSKIFTESDIEEKVHNVWDEFDVILVRNGYRRKRNLYEVIKPNLDEIVVVTHFATMAIILGHLLNISVFITLNMLFMAPSSYTILATEEIQHGKAIFRCLELGSTKHLYGNNELKSEYGRQDEIKENFCGKQD